MKKIVLVTSLYRLRKFNACATRYAHLVDKLAPQWGDKDDINLLDILEHNGVSDCLWALRAAVEHPEGDRAMRLMAADFAEAVLPIFEEKYPKDKRPRNAIKAARDIAYGKITSRELASAGAAAEDAAEDATEAVAWAAAKATAKATAWDAARAATEAAALAATQATAWAEQAKIIRKYLGRKSAGEGGKC